MIITGDTGSKKFVIVKICRCALYQIVYCSSRHGSSGFWPSRCAWPGEAGHRLPWRCFLPLRWPIPTEHNCNILKSAISESVDLANHIDEESSSSSNLGRLPKTFATADQEIILDLVARPSGCQNTWIYANELSVGLKRAGNIFPSDLFSSSFDVVDEKGYMTVYILGVNLLPFDGRSREI